MAFFRSERMTLCQLVLHQESAFNCLVELALTEKVQLRQIYDDDAICNNRFSMDIQRCHEVERMIIYLEAEMNDFNIKPTFHFDDDSKEVPKVTDLKDAENYLEEFYTKASEIKNNVDVLQKRRNELYEKEQVLLKAEEILSGERFTESVVAVSDSVTKILMHDEINIDGKESFSIKFLAGTIETSRYPAFQIMVYRVSRGNCFLHNEHTTVLQKESDGMDKSVSKYVFMLFFMGQSLREKLGKVCQGFGIRLFECPESNEERKFAITQIKQDIVDLNNVLNETAKQQRELLKIIADNLYIWKVKIKRIAMVYFVMNHMKRVKRLQVEKYLQTECWIPTNEVVNVKVALAQGVQRSSQNDSINMFPAMIIELNRKTIADEEKPTFFQLNRFTRGFQNLVDAYGIAAYRELNPAPYTIITFPFLFAVMFGDMGHGVLMALFGFYMIVKEKKFEREKRRQTQPNEIWDIMFSGRYIILLMGLFSIYTGLVYNDIFSKSLNIFGSRWYLSRNETMNMKGHRLYQLDPTKNYKGDPYWCGMDPVWDAAGENSITTFNSVKMKMAIILGVIHMMFGLILAACNHIMKKEYSEFFLVFIPQMTFMTCIFFYLIFMIFFKWLHYGGLIASPHNSACAPSVLIIFINMLLMKEPDKPPEGCLLYMYNYQNIVQSILLYTSLISVPILLAGRPFFIMYQRKNLTKLKTEEGLLSRKQSTASSIKRTLVYNVENSISTLRVIRPYAYEEEALPEKQDMVEVWIHSGIHCIESVLGSVSHTASYLRLWALSLAHDQLSGVLWNMVLDVGLVTSKGYMNALIIYVAFNFWAVLTIAILVIMEGLSAFLHTLRLHWVEFQSKFYAGSGIKFTPFAFPESNASG